MRRIEIALTVGVINRVLFDDDDEAQRQFDALQARLNEDKYGRNASENPVHRVVADHESVDVVLDKVASVTLLDPVAWTEQNRPLVEMDEQRDLNYELRRRKAPIEQNRRLGLTETDKFGWT